MDYPDDYDRLMDEAAELMDEGDADGALPMLLDAARLVPEDPEVWQRLGAVRFARGEAEDAKDAYARWWELAPQNPLAFRAYANLLFRMGRLEEAEAAALAWLGREPNDPYAFLMLANARYKRGTEYDLWLDSARKLDPDLFRNVMLDVFDYARGSGSGEWSSLEAAEALGIPEIRLIERAARGGLPRYYNPETETFTFNRKDFEDRQEILDRYGLSEEDRQETEDGPVEVDFATDIDDLDDNAEVRVLLQKCPHCGEWTAGPLGDRERYFCCGAPMDPFIELSSEIEVQGRIVRKAGGGRELSEGIKRLTPDQIAELKSLWEDEDDWLSRAEALLAKAANRRG